MANNAMAVQRQVRENAQELNDFLTSFASWQKDITAKDRQLIQSAKENQDCRFDGMGEGSRPVRSPPEEKSRLGSPPPPNVPSPLKVESGTSKKGQISPDPVQKSLKFGDDSERKDEKKTTSIQQQEASAEKERGNDHFKNGRYDQAIESYSRGMKCDPSNAMLPANRAMALLKKGRHREAEADCTLALSLDPTYVKAYQRRATARASLKLYQQAVKDFKKVLELEPNNKAAKTEIVRLEQEEHTQKLQKIKEQSMAKDQTLNVKENLKANLFKDNKPSIPGQVFPVDKKPHQRSKKPLRRIDIREVRNKSGPGSVSSGGDFLIKESSDKLKSTVSKRIEIEEVETSKSDSYQESSTIRINSSGDNDEIGSGSFLIRESKVTETDKLVPSQPKKTKVQIEEIESESLTKHHQENASPVKPTQAAPPPMSNSAQVRKVEEQILSTSESVVRGSSCDSSNLSSVNKVKSSMAFYAAWKSLSSKADKFTFLNSQMTTSKSYSTLFNHSLESEVFEDIVAVLHGNPDAESSDICRHLVGLSKVPRISAMVMFMDNRGMLQDLVRSHVDKNGSLDQSEVQSVKNCFS